MSTVRLSTTLSAMSYALDLTKGQPQGHAARSCLIGMRLAAELRLTSDERSDLFYALLMKDAGCSSNAARVYQLFGGDDQPAKHGLWVRDWRRWRDTLAYAIEYAEPGGTPLQRVRRLASLAVHGRARSRELFAIRCDRGADIARELGVSEPTAIAIRTTDEHWDGGGYPEGLQRQRTLTARENPGDRRRLRRPDGGQAVQAGDGTGPGVVNAEGTRNTVVPGRGGGPL